MQETKALISAMTGESRGGSRAAAPGCEAKVLKIEVSENQISGGAIELNINYDDVLDADCFDD